MSRETRLDYLAKGGYRTGRTLKEDGDYLNFADYLDFQLTYDVKYQTSVNGSSLLSLTSSVATEYYYYGLTVPEGREFIIFDRILTLGEGAYDVDAITTTGGYTGGTESYKSLLNATGTPSVMSTLHAGVTPVGTVTIRDQDHIDSGIGLGAGRSSASSEREGLMRVFGSGNNGLLRVRRLQATNYTINIRIVCWERDAS